LPADGQEAASIAVVHLARCANGHDVFQGFLNSYAAYSPGIEHDLVVVLKGYETDAGTKALAMNALRPHRARILEIPEQGLDLDAYRAAASAFHYSYYCFLNSFSRIAADDWLAKMIRVARQPNVGIVGATGSYRSILSDELSGLREILARRIGRLFRAFRHVARGERQANPNPAAPGAMMSGHISLPSDQPSGLWTSLRNLPRRVTWTLQILWFFPRFPNAHVRTNGFVLSRPIMHRLRWPRTVSKIDAYFLESGRRSLTAQVAKMGLAPMLVGKDGRGYSVEEWPTSGIFWQGEQENLLLKDNQTLEYDLGSADERRRLYGLVWQDGHGSAV
jgi:hypothetical protein